MIFSYNWLQSFFTRKLPKPEKLAELLTMHSFEVGEVKKAGSDWTLDIDVLPNRAGDCFSHFGIAREIAAIINSKFEIRNSKQIINSKLQTKDFVSVDVRAKQACLRYTAKVITDVKVGPSPKWLKDKLEVCGLNSINNVVDAANYVMLETGQPMHAFDLEKLEDQKIIVRFAKEDEKITTLDNQVFNLNPAILVIADVKKPVAIAGIKGGTSPEISEATKTIVLESANFDPTITRRASKELNLKTDASLRFEHGIDPNLSEIAIDRAAEIISRVAGGQIASGLVDFYSKKVLPKRIKLDLDYLKSLLGIEISAAEVKVILNSLGFKIIGVRLPLLVEIPTFRLDISLQEDLIEEVGRIYGYDKIPVVFPLASLIPPVRNDNLFWTSIVKDIFRGVGFTEIYNYSFQKEAGEVEVENPQSLEYRYLRPSLIPNLLKNVEKNSVNFKKIKIFELGKVFEDKTEKRMLTGMLVGEDFYRLKGVIDSLFNKLGIVKVWYDDYQASPEDSPKSLWHHKKSAEIKVRDIELGFLGELKDKPNIVAFDLDFDKLTALASEEHEYRQISKYPATIRDLAVLVPALTRVEEVLNVIETAGGSILKDVDLFDIYEGEGIGDGKKNLAFHFVYQAEDRTLTSIEVYKIHQKIIEALEENPEWEVRR
ncbi:MAG: phenylalanine--tRNA ligase subunit beta [Candidatus Nealsonbacteria bacterium]|nr:phenylalanine--tRNA ligase subunit beta [Candidatus Nealsonbacteria bacterium]